MVKEVAAGVGSGSGGVYRKGVFAGELFLPSLRISKVPSARASRIQKTQFIQRTNPGFGRQGSRKKACLGMTTLGLAWPFDGLFCLLLPKGEAVGAVRQVEEPADVQMGDEHL